jgi:hypothetical protein
LHPPTSGVNPPGSLIVKLPEVVNLCTVPTGVELYAVPPEESIGGGGGGDVNLPLESNLEPLLNKFLNV